MKDRLERLEVANRFVDEQSETGSDMSISSTNSHSDVGDAKFTAAMTDREKAAAKQAVLAPDADAGYAKSTPTMSAKQIKRGEKKERKKREAAVAKDALLAPDISIASEHHPGIFDETLLAVIGILDEMKPQENVAAWVKHGDCGPTNFLRLTARSSTMMNVISVDPEVQRMQKLTTTASLTRYRRRPLSPRRPHLLPRLPLPQNQNHHRRFPSDNGQLTATIVQR